MNFWKQHVALRIGLICGCFVLGLVLVVFGWTQTGKLVGLFEMLLGVALLLAGLAIYNAPYSK